MPLFDYVCRSCQHAFEALVRPQDAPPRCPACASADLDKAMSTFAVSSSERTQAAATKARRKAATVAHKENILAERDIETHRREDH